MKSCLKALPRCPLAELDPPKPRRPVAWWVLVTFVCLIALQAGPPLYIVIVQERLAGFDWAGFIGYALGSVAVPMVVGCLGLIYRRHAGLAYFVLSLAVFLFASFGNLAV